ncbi:MAG TPA: YfiR family protein [Bacteroidia bacterium]|nr:YfiR family protein [Bacteroidia bacterium]
MKRLLVICLGLFMISAAYQQKEDVVQMNAHCKAIFLYNFTKYIEWPDEYKAGNFVIGVYGSYVPLLNELNKMAATKTAGSQKFEIKSVSTVEAAAKYHILFISKENLGQFSEISNKLTGRGTLLVTEKDGMTKKGSAINFVQVDSKIKFQLSKPNAEKHYLKVSTALEALAVKENE